MDDLAIIECVEGLRQYVTKGLTGSAIFALSSPVSRDTYLSVRPDQLVQHMVVAAFEFQADLPNDLRQAELICAWLESAHAQWETPGLSNGCGGPTNREAHVNCAIPGLSVEARQKLDDPPVIGNLIESFQRIQSEHPKLGKILGSVTNADAAARAAGKFLPVLRGMMCYQFLAAIRYPTAIPSAGSTRLLSRLGILAFPPEQRRPGKSQFHETTAKIARLAGLEVEELGWMLEVFSGSRPLNGFKAPCVQQARCGDCPLTLRCTWFRYRGNEDSGDTSRPIKQWCADERPRERMLAGERLSTAELIGVVLRTGSGRKSAVDLGRQLLTEFGSLHRLEKASPRDLTRVKGIGLAKAVEIKAAIELGRRITQPAADERDGLKPVGCSRDVFDLYRPRYKSATQEEFLLLVLNTKNRIQREIVVSVGTLNSSIVHPRDVFNHALREAAAGVIFVHNHPSGDPTPSPEDHALTKRLAEAGSLLGIKVMDHIIIGSQKYYSFADEGSF
jgi:DNA repair protein RadC